LDAEVLLAHVLGVSRERLIVDRDLVVEGAAVRAFQNAVRRRAVEREPVAYIVGHRGFRRLELAVDPRALIPRPETELLVAVALSLPHGARVLDVGTGSGAVALALKDERPDLQVTGSDRSEDALALARFNGEGLGLAVDWLQADLLSGVPDEFDAILSNPPYVAESDRGSLAPEILRHEPPKALYAGPDGLDTIRALLAQVTDRRRVQTVALEIGAGQAPAVSKLLRAAGIERVVVGSGECDVGVAGRGSGIRGNAGSAGPAWGNAVTAPAPAALGVEDARRLERCLADGGVAVFPADTVYGLCCDPLNESAVRRLYELKGRPAERPAAVMFFAPARLFAALPDLGDRERAALGALLPGPVTLLLGNPTHRFPLAGGPGEGGADTLGVRVPAWSPPLAALGAMSAPVLQSSANLSGEPDARRLHDVPASIRSGADLVLDGGELPGVPSTVLDLREYERHGAWRIVREGPLMRADLERILERTLAS
jgi:release factor glutamine methyltransferase